MELLHDQLVNLVLHGSQDFSLRLRDFFLQAEAPQFFTFQ